MTKSTTPITDAASMSLASIRNSTASRYAYFVPSEVARGLELALIESALLTNSPTWPYVLAFAKRMEAKLAKNRHKGDREGWLKDEPWSLVKCILDETVEVQQCFTMGSDDRIDFKDAEELADECADVANFCMMVADCATTQDGSDNLSTPSKKRVKKKGKK